MDIRKISEKIYNDINSKSISLKLSSLEHTTKFIYDTYEICSEFKIGYLDLEYLINISKIEDWVHVNIYLYNYESYSEMYNFGAGWHKTHVSDLDRSSELIISHVNEFSKSEQGVKITSLISLYKELKSTLSYKEKNFLIHLLEKDY